MIVIDYSGTMYSSFLATHVSSSDVDENFIRHLILNSIRSYLTKFRHEFGNEVVIACDSSNNWRRTKFPYYKASRKKSRDESGFNWAKIFDIFSKIREEITENFPYNVIWIDTVEADDIIATVVKQNTDKKTLIISTDKDFCQLQKYPNVKQYNPVKKNFVECPDPAIFLSEHIIYGDKGDGIPNILSDDDTFVAGKRQKPIRQTKVDIWCTMTPEQFCENERVLRNYYRNAELIDFSHIPEEISEKILNKYSEYKKPTINLMKYFMDKKLNNLVSSMGDF